MIWKNHKNIPLAFLIPNICLYLVLVFINSLSLVLCPGDPRWSKGKKYLHDVSISFLNNWKKNSIKPSLKRKSKQ